MDPSLLSPSIADGRAPERTYSTGATFMTTFFGGPIAAVTMHALNVHFAGRFERDRVVFVLAAIVAVAIPIVLGAIVARPELLASMGALAESRNVRYVVRGAGLLLWAALFLRLRPLYRAAELHGEHRPAFMEGFVIVTVSSIVTLILTFLGKWMIG